MVSIQRVDCKNQDVWKQLAKEFWPYIKQDDYNTILSDNYIHAEFICKVDDMYVGFIDGSIRKDYVEGCKGKFTGYIEGIYVNEKFRHKGLATKLLQEFEKWAKSLGVTELASDAEIDNEASIKFHNKNGYKTVSKNIHFAKKI